MRAPRICSATDDRAHRRIDLQHAAQIHRGQTTTRHVGERRPRGRGHPHVILQADGMRIDPRIRSVADVQTEVISGREFRVQYLGVAGTEIRYGGFKWAACRGLRADEPRNGRRRACCVLWHRQPPEHAWWCFFVRCEKPRSQGCLSAERLIIPAPGAQTARNSDDSAAYWAIPCRMGADQAAAIRPARGGSVIGTGLKSIGSPVTDDG